MARKAEDLQKPTKSKNANPGEYNRSTGFEAVLGYLYLIGDEERIKELLANSDDEDYKRAVDVQAFKPVRR